MPASARSESTKRGGTSSVSAVRSRHAATDCATPRAAPRSWRAPLMRHHAMSGSGRDRTRCRRSSHSSSAHCNRPTASSRSTSTSCNAIRYSTSAAAYACCSGRSGRRVQSVRRSPLVSRVPEQSLDHGGERRCAEPDEAGRDLGVEQLSGTRPAGPFEDRDVLVGGVGDHAARPVEEPGQRSDVQLERIDEDDAAGPGDLDQGQPGPIGALAVEFGVEREAGLAGQLLDARSQCVGRIDPAGFHGRQACPSADRELDLTHCVRLVSGRGYWVDLPVPGQVGGPHAADRPGIRDRECRVSPAPGFSTSPRWAKERRTAG